MPSSHRAARGQMSDSLLTASFIILSGGLQDAYTYLCRGKVFANAQTGNIVLLECVHRHFKYMERVHWRQLIILSEIVLLFAVGFLPQERNMAANMLVSFVCAMQVQTFRKVRGHAYASTMCIGNLRSGTEALCEYFHDKNPAVLRRALTYFGVIGIFALGAGAGAWITARAGERTIWISCALLTVSFLLMFLREKRAEEKELL